MNYPAKILLFGEQTVLKGSEALALPLFKLGGNWRREKNDIAAARLHPLLRYLEKVIPEKNLPLDVSALKRDVFEYGFWFESDVPEGYGAGSSGALIAALYDNYVSEKVRDITVLKKELGIMESFFHGTSSGFDPLVSFLKKPVRIRRDGSIEIPVKEIISPLSLFLIDTHIIRRTETFVYIFTEKYNDVHFRKHVDNTLIPETDAAVAFFLEGRKENLFESLHQISWFQFRFFSAFIPDGFRDIWLEGLSSKHFKVKLCGAGGGGFLLCFSNDAEETEKILKEKNLTFLKV